MTDVTLAPWQRGSAVELGRQLFRKQVLPLGTIDYKGRKITFDRSYLTGLERAYHDSAFDSVPFMLADADNRHTRDPERARGKICDMEMTNDGLDMLFEPDSEESAQLIRSHPELGVSARIVESYSRADGKSWPAAIQHVLGTFEPHVTGMRPWEAVSLSHDDSERVRVIDLTDDDVRSSDEEGDGMTTPSDQQTGTPANDDDEGLLSRLRQRLGLGSTAIDEPRQPRQEPRTVHAVAEPQGTDDAAGTAGQPDGGDSNDDNDNNDNDNDDALSDDELADILRELESEETTDGEDDGVTYPRDDAAAWDDGQVATAREHDDALELANAQLNEQGGEIRRLRSELDAQAYAAERDQFARDYGIPPRVTELARPLLEGDNRTIELANGGTVDPGAVMRSVLKEIGGQIQLLNLSGQLGTEFDPSEAQRKEEEKTARKEFSNDVRQRFGL